MRVLLSKRFHPKSILCLPLQSQQRIIGVLYLSNQQTENAFVSLLLYAVVERSLTPIKSPDRLEILSLISGQAASTIEKARLVHDLKLANSDLKRSQSQLETYNRNLEETVADRTLELRNAKDVAEAATSMKSQFLGGFPPLL